MVITSKDNETIKKIRKLKEKKYRDEYNEYIIEGIKLIKEAIMEKANIKTIVVCDNCNKQEEIGQTLLYDIAKYNCSECSKEIKAAKIKGQIRTPKEIVETCGGLCLDCYKKKQKKSEDN